MIIGIGGVSNAGKSKLAIEVKSYFPLKDVLILCQDDFVKPAEMIPQINNHIDWETPESIDVEAYKKAIISASEIDEVVIAEGIFAFSYPSLNLLYDKRIFVSISKEVFMERKMKDLRWGREPNWYIHHIWDSYLQHGKLSGDEKDYLFIDEGDEDKKQRILDYLKNP